MSPKFRGGSDDWLDDEDSLQRSKKPGGGAKKPARRAGAPLDASEANATVSEVFPNQCQVWVDVADGTPVERVLCSYRRAEVIAGAKSERSPVAVGDRVRIEVTGDGSGVVEGICERENFLSRPAPGREAQDDQSLQQHVIAANVDCLVIVASCTNPEFSPGLVDRYLVSASAAGIPVVIAVTKVDLLAGAPERAWELYRSLGYELFETTTRGDTSGADSLRKRLTGIRAVFAGHSGVGKTSLLRQLTGTETGKVGKVSDSTQKGRHTTSSAVLLEGPGASRWIDTPGVRAFGLGLVQAPALASHFPELVGLACGQPACLHFEEADCLARGLPRYASYRRILCSLLSGEF